jgi:hypothetical protein
LKINLINYSYKKGRALTIYNIKMMLLILFVLSSSMIYCEDMKLEIAYPYINNITNLSLFIPLHNSLYGSWDIDVDYE